MKSQASEDTTKNNYHLLAIHTNEDLCLNSVRIDNALRKICSYFSSRIGIADREILVFCLQHIFYNTNQIYTLLLPEVTACTTESTDEENDHSRTRNMPMRNMPTKNINIQYQLWSSLQEIEFTLERLQFLCQLIISATTNMLNELDRTCSVHITTQHLKTENGKQTYERQTSNSDQLESDDDDTWQWGLAQAIEKTHTWLQNNQDRLSFSGQFAILAPMIPALAQIDTALDNLLKSVYTIFSDILPDLPESITDGDESSATLLLDLIQRCDQILLQLGILAEPLHVLTGQYILETTLQ